MELAILLPVLIILLFGFVEFGRALMQTNTLNKAVTMGARYVARVTGAVDTGNCTAGPAWTAAETQATLLIAYDNAGTGSLILKGLDDSDAIQIAPRSSDTANLCVVTVSASAPFTPILGDSLVPFFQVGPITIHAQAEERYIGE